ncbi:MAG TPA: hypothetical protein VGX70_15985 [Gemmataceae bacterium]|nr:hypothetical protein [Gemmataceae bacterium]
MDAAVFDDLKDALADRGPAAAIDRLCQVLREQKDYSSLFYALLLKKRHELGVSPVPTGSAQDLPEETHESYEEAIRLAGRDVGQLFLKDGDIPKAWIYFRMLGENLPVYEALSQYQPRESDDIQQLVDIAFHQGVHPRKGFDLLLERYGICSAITMVGSQEMGMPPDVRDYCIRQLVRALHAELCQRLKAEITHHDGSAPDVSNVRDLMSGRDWLFQEDFYHIDISHLSAVVQMSIFLSQGEERRLARELCDYGKRLSPRFQNPGEPPFENQYQDYSIYLAALDGEAVEQAVDHFRDKADGADPENEGTRPAEVLVNFLVRLGRPKEALRVARQHLASVNHRPLNCPSLVELCQRTKDFRALAEIAREQGDLVHFMAGLVAASKNEN